MGSARLQIRSPDLETLNQDPELRAGPSILDPAIKTTEPDPPLGPTSSLPTRDQLLPHTNKLLWLPQSDHHPESKVQLCLVSTELKECMSDEKASKDFEGKGEDKD